MTILLVTTAILSGVEVQAFRIDLKDYLKINFIVDHRSNLINEEEAVILPSI